MAKGYWIARVDVADPEGYKAYVAANAEPFRQFGARFLVRGGAFENVEGGSRAQRRDRVRVLPAGARLLELPGVPARTRPAPAAFHGRRDHRRRLRPPPSA